MQLSVRHNRNTQTTAAVAIGNVFYSFGLWHYKKIEEGEKHTAVAGPRALRRTTRK